MNANPPTPKHRFSGCFLAALMIAFIGFALFFFLVVPELELASEMALSSKGCLHAFRIWQGLEDYAADHQGNYPAGKSSTEIFQVLLDGHYVDNPNLFYLPMSGKIEAKNSRLKSENVSWDMTICVEGSPPERAPLIFATGYRLRYQPSASALPLKRRSWWKSWKVYLPICYQGGKATVLFTSPDGTIPNFIPADFDPKGKTYRQLTPDGELPP